MTHRKAWAEVARQVEAGDVEETLNALAAWMDVEAQAQTSARVRSCVKSSRDSLRQAAMDFYVSTK